MQEIYIYIQIKHRDNLLYKREDTFVIYEENLLLFLAASLSFQSQQTFSCNSDFSQQPRKEMKFLVNNTFNSIADKSYICS